MARDVLLAYPNYGELFEIYTDASTRQLGAVITQKGRPLAFFSRKLNSAQQKYSVTELELLSIVECLREFKGMLWGQKLKVYTNHKNLVRDALGLTCDRVYRWRLILKEYDPEIVYIKGTDNIVADAISWLDYSPDVNTRNINVHARMKTFTQSFNSYVENTDVYDPFQTLYAHETCVDVTRDNPSVQQQGKYLFANNSSTDEEIYPPTISEIAEAQSSHHLFSKYYKDNPFKGRNNKISPKVIDGIRVLTFETHRLVIPTAKMQNDVITWYHHYLQHPGENRLEETIVAVMYWKGMRTQIRKHVRTCDRCQLAKRHKRKYGHLPPKIATVTPWKQVCVDLIGPYTIKAKDKTALDFMCLTMIDPATSWFEIVELPTTEVQVVRDGKEVVEVILDKSSSCIARLFNKSWLSRYPRAKYITYDNGSEFKLFFEQICEQYSLKRKPTTIKNPQANAILERVHAVCSNMIKTSNLDMQDTCTPEMVDELIANIGWAIRATYHTLLGSSPGAAIFGRDMLFDIPYLADWSEIGRKRQLQVDKSNVIENRNRIDFDYKVGQKVVLIKDHIFRKAEDSNLGPFTITDVFVNGTVRIQRGTINERLNIRRLRPYFER